MIIIYFIILDFLQMYNTLIAINYHQSVYHVFFMGKIPVIEKLSINDTFSWLQIDKVKHIYAQHIDRYEIRIKNIYDK